ncbi:MAG: hypothetical protein IPJ88_05160 [Myxococcales bacterium]|nr:MAG: hypothetical protein IPJ88_05160 [Myxococcales bacterium]
MRKCSWFWGLFVLAGCVGDVYGLAEPGNENSVSGPAENSMSGAGSTMTAGFGTASSTGPAEFPIEQWQALETFYLSPDGSDDSDGSAENPWFSFSHAMSHLKPGSHLILKDGVYKQSLDVTVSGSEEHPIVIRAENDGGAVIDGEGLRHTFQMKGTADAPMHDAIFWGFSAGNSNHHVFDLTYVQRVVFKRITGHDAVQVDMNHNVFTCAYNCSDVLVEDSAAWGTGRILFRTMEARAAPFGGFMHAMAAITTAVFVRPLPCMDPRTVLLKTVWSPKILQCKIAWKVSRSIVAMATPMPMAIVLWAMLSMD